MDKQSTLQRDSSIDIMRFIGLSCIILAHIGLGSKSTLFQLRTFDVPMMIFISGLAYAGKQTGNYFAFVWKRLKRLVVPVYIFLAVYFLVDFLAAQFGIDKQIPSNKIVGSFLLRNTPSIKYVWVIRVFLIVMLLTPPLMKLNGLLKRNWQFLLTLAAMLTAQYFLVAWLRPLKLGRFVNDYLLYAVGYSSMFMLGLRMKEASVSTKWLVILLFAAAFAAMAFGVDADKGTWLRMQSFKYPPQVYYLLWGGTVSGLLWATKKWWCRLLDWRPMRFIGQNTIWIYLWHIPFVAPVNAALKDAGWGWRYLLVYCAAVGVYLLQYHIVDRIERSGGDKKHSLTKFFKG